MLYLSGGISQLLLREANIGFILSPNKGNRPHLSGVPWAVDNGCFSKAHAFMLPRYLRYLEVEMAYARTSCLFATAPDVLADAEATWRQSSSVLPLIRVLGYPAALVAQDGLERMRVDWDAFDVLFLGGSTRWKLSQAAAQLVATARHHGKHTHMGRVNSGRRLRYAQEIGCDSVDGTHLAFNPGRNLRRLRDWQRDLSERPSLWTPATA